ncbi:MAG: hypothetical protein QOF83_3077 [Solirubrobacteraceae bacterium]|nr:hypothetical protein [Solirubrobacteraceae bacterium]
MPRPPVVRLRWSAVDDQLQRRLASNQAMFRKVNEGIARGQWPGDENQRVGFRCECARLGCNSLVQLTPRDYERVRANPRRFVIIAGHELPDVEHVVDRSYGYFVVEKHDEAGVVAQETDPRS